MGLVGPCLTKECLKEKWNLQVMYYEAVIGQCIMKLYKDTSMERETEEGSVEPGSTI